MKNLNAVALGRLGGLAGKGKTSKRKAAASRANGRKGGRPKGARSMSVASNMAVFDEGERFSTYAERD